MIKAMKLMLVLLCTFLLGFTSIDRHLYEFIYDKNRVSPEKIIKTVEDYLLLHGYKLKTKIVETVPEHRLVSTFVIGRPYEGGVMLTLTLRDGKVLTVDGERPRGGCSKQEEIDGVTKLVNALSAILDKEFSTDVQIKRINGSNRS